MWLLRVETSPQAPKNGGRAKPGRTKFVPLPFGKTLKVGRTSENDVTVDHSAVSKSVGRIILGQWSGKINKQGQIPPGPIEYYNDAQASGSKLTLSQAAKDPSKQKPVTVFHPDERTPRDENGKIADHATDADYQQLNEWGKIEIEDGTKVQFTKSASITFNWRPYVLADTDQTADRIELAQKLRVWGVSHHKQHTRNLTTHSVIQVIEPSSEFYLKAVSCATYIVRPDFLETLLQSLETCSQAEGVTLPTESDFLPTINPAQPSQAVSTQNAPSMPASRMLTRGNTEIPSTHPNEDFAMSESQPIEEEVPVATKTLGSKGPLKRRAGEKKKISLFDDSSEDDMPPPVKRMRTQVPETLPSQVANTGYQSTQTPAEVEKLTVGETYATRSGPVLKRRAGTIPMKAFWDMDDSRDEDDESANEDQLAKYRKLYDTNKNKSGVPDSMPMDGSAMDELYTQAQTQARATSGPAATPMNVDGDDDDGFLQYIKKKTEQEKKKKTSAMREIEEEEEQEEEAEGMIEPPPGDNQPSQQTQFQHAERVPPTAPGDVSKDEQFLLATIKAKRGAKKIDEFDLEFNALKLSKPAKTAATSNMVNANKSRQTEEELYRLLEDMDTSTTGNFIVIERMDLFRKDKKEGQQANPFMNPEWAGKKNFKKFKKQHVARQPPVPMMLKSVVDYGLGNTYWANEGAAAPTADPSSSSQAPTQARSQTQTQRPTAFTQAPAQATGKAKRKLIVADSDDEDIPIRPLRRTGRTQASPTPDPTPSVPASRLRRGRSATPSEQVNEPPPKATRGRKKAAPLLDLIEEDEDQEEPEYNPMNGPTATRRGTRARTTRAGSIMGDSTQADNLLPSRASSTVATGTGTGTGRATRKRLLVDSDDEDPILTRKRKKH